MLPMPMQTRNACRPRPVATHDPEATRMPDHHGDGQQRDAAAEQHQLEGAVGAAQRLYHGVHGAEREHERAQLEVDAVQRSWRGNVLA